MALRRYLYYPGCSLRGTGVAYDESLRECFRQLGLELVELEDWNCCGATSYMAIDEGAACVLSARVLALAQQQAPGVDLVAPCSACYLVLRKTEDYISRYPEIRSRVEASLRKAGLPVQIGVQVRHPLEVLWEDVGPEAIRKRVQRHWRGGRVACYYGCQAVRPYGEVDRPIRPTRLDELMEAVNVPVVDYSLRTRCCGGSLTGTIHEVGLRLNYILLKEAVRRGAEAIVTMCPLCQFNLDVFQNEMEQQTGEPFDLPVLYFTQVLGWCLGAELEKLGLRHLIAGRDLVERWFVKERPVEAYV